MKPIPNDDVQTNTHGKEELDVYSNEQRQIVGKIDHMPMFIRANSNNGIGFRIDTHAFTENAFEIGDPGRHQYTYIIMTTRELRDVFYNTKTGEQLQEKSWSLNWHNVDAAWLSSDNPPRPDGNFVAATNLNVDNGKFSTMGVGGLAL